MNCLVLSDSPILERAKPIFENRKINRWTFTDSDSINPKTNFKHIFDNYDLVFSLHCKKIFPKKLTDSVRCINIHPGFNPYNRGMFPHVWSIVNGLWAGATIHEMSDDIDNGPIICQEEVLIKDSDTSTTLYNRILNVELQLLDKWLDEILDNNYQTFAADSGNYNSGKDFHRLCDIDPDRVGTFREFYDLLRALSHAGYMNASMNGIKFKLIIDENTNTPNDKG